MPNPYFKFKEFTVWQDACGMKVTTDACLFGAIVDPEKAKNALDIGTGTGLLSLMLAQKSAIPITGIEKNTDACRQAKINFQNAPWANQLQVVEADVMKFQPEEGYDLIICNPPFFGHRMKGKSDAKNQAMFQESLTLDKLAQSIIRLLNPNGTFWVMLPEHEMSLFTNLPHIQTFHLQQQINIHNKAQSPIFRIIKAFSRDKVVTKHSLLSIRSDDDYTSDFIRLMKPYYLNL